MPESFSNPCACVPIPGTVPPAIAPYVVSINSLNGLITLGDTGSITWTSIGNTLFANFSASAGLGSVTSVAVASNNSNLVVASGSPITTLGTINLTLAGNIGSISGLTMGADQSVYSTGAGTFVAYDLTSFARTLLDDANAAAMRSTLGLVIGTNVQAFSQDLADFVTNSSYSGSSLTLLGAQLTVEDFVANGTGSFGGVVTMSSSLGVGTSVTAASFSGDGSALTALNASNLTTGTTAVARGGTGLSSYTVGQVLYASGATTIAGLTAGASGTFLRFAGAGVAPVVSTLILPNAATTGDIFMATSANTMGRLANVATGNVLLSGGVGVASAFGKVTSSHVNNTIPTMSGGFSSDLLGVSQPFLFGDTVEFANSIELNGQLLDVSDFEGNAGDILVSTSSGVQWSTQITLSTITINTSISMEATITAGGTTGAQVINKPAGTVNFAAAASSLIVTNSLVTANSLVHAFVRTNDATARIANVVPTLGAFTINLTAAATAETSVGFIVIQPS